MHNLLSGWAGYLRWVPTGVPFIEPFMGTFHRTLVGTLPGTATPTRRIDLRWVYPWGGPPGSLQEPWASGPSVWTVVVELVLVVGLDWVWCSVCGRCWGYLVVVTTVWTVL